MIVRGNIKSKNNTYYRNHCPNSVAHCNLKKRKRSKNIFVPASIFEVSTGCRIQCLNGNTHAKIYLIRYMLSGEKIKMCKAYRRWTPSDSKSSHGLCLGELKMDDECISVWPTNMERCIYITHNYLLQNIKAIIIVGWGQIDAYGN